MKRLLLIVFLLPVFAGCDYDETLKKFLPQEESAFATRYLEDLRAKRFDEAKKTLRKDMLTPDIEARLAKAVSYFPDGDVIEIKPIGSSVHTTPNLWLAQLSYQYHLTNGWALAQISLERGQDGLVVTGVNIMRLPKPLDEIYAFNFQDKGPIQYIFLALTVAIPIFILSVLVVCIRTPIAKRKWAWILFILFGVVAFRLNWTTAEFGMQLVSIHLFGAAAFASSPYAPWILTISIPLGAIVFLIRRPALIQRAAKTSAAEPAKGTDS